MADAISFSERRPAEGQLVTVFCDEWTHPKVATFTADFEGSGNPRLLGKDGRHYWYPERMTWRPHFELKAVS